MSGNDMIYTGASRYRREGLAGSSYEDTLAAYKENPEFFN